MSHSRDMEYLTLETRRDGRAHTQDTEGRCLTVKKNIKQRCLKCDMFPHYVLSSSVTKRRKSSHARHRGKTFHTQNIVGKHVTLKTSLFYIFYKISHCGHQDLTSRHQDLFVITISLFSHSRSHTRSHTHDLKISHAISNSISHFRPQHLSVNKISLFSHSRSRDFIVLTLYISHSISHFRQQDLTRDLTLYPRSLCHQDLTLDLTL